MTIGDHLVGWATTPIPTNSHEKANISVSINIFKLVDIDEDDYSIEIKFKITLQWRENRATYHNLKENDNLNTLIENDIETLWQRCKKR